MLQPETKTDRALLARPGQIIIVADHAKCEGVSTAFVAPVTARHTLITDTNVSPDFITALAGKTDQQPGIQSASPIAVEPILVGAISMFQKPNLHQRTSVPDQSDARE